MKRFFPFCLTVMALGLATVAHADSIMASGYDAAGSPLAAGTQVAGMSVSGSGLGADAHPYVVAQYYSYSAIPGAQWVSPSYEPISGFAVSAPLDQDYTFTQSFFALGSFHLQGKLLSDNNLVSAYLDVSSNTLANVPVVSPDPRADQDLFASYTSPLDFGPTAGIALANHSLVFVIHNRANNFSYNPVALDFLVAVIQPVVECGITQGALWPPNHNLVNVGLVAPSIRGGSGPSTVTVTVLSNEVDQPSGAKGDDHFSPDASNQGLGTLRLRAERLGTGGGRVYLIIVKATDIADDTGYCTSTVVVPHDQSAASIAAVNAAAAQAAARFEATGIYPDGYTEVGGPGAPVNGPKQ